MHVLKDTIMIYWDILVAFSKFEWFISSDHKIKNFSTHFIHKLLVAFQYGPEATKSTLLMRYSARYVEFNSVSKVGRIIVLEHILIMMYM